MILIDSNVIIDVIDGDTQWAAWSMVKIAEAGAMGPTVINDIVIAEVAPNVGALEEFYTELERLNVNYQQICDQSVYLAGLAYLDYRKRRQGAKSILADFLIGGHAQILGATILTRDPRFYRAYFPSVAIIAPDTVD